MFKKKAQPDTVKIKNNHAIIALTITPMLPLEGHYFQVTQHSKQSYKAIAHYADGAIQNITELVCWISKNNEVAHFTTNATTCSKRTGETDIFAYFKNIKSNTIKLQVVDNIISPEKAPVR